MTKEEFYELIETGRELEFNYKSKRYSITYYPDDREKYISFCEFYKEPIDVAKPTDLDNVYVDGVSVTDIVCSITKDEDLDIF